MFLHKGKDQSKNVSSCTAPTPALITMTIWELEGKKSRKTKQPKPIQLIALIAWIWQFRLMDL